MGKKQQRIIKYMADENKKYSHNLTKIDLNKNPPFTGVIIPSEVWRSNRFIVQIFYEKVTRLSVNRTMVNAKGEWLEGITWEELQDIKNQCGYRDKTAVELFPCACDVVNVVNIRHLFILDEIPDYQWRS